MSRQAARLIPRSPSRYLVTGTVLLVSAGGARAGLPYFTVWPPLLWERLFGPQCAGGVPSESSESTQQWTACGGGTTDSIYPLPWHAHVGPAASPGSVFVDGLRNGCGSVLTAAPAASWLVSALQVRVAVYIRPCPQKPTCQWTSKLKVQSENEDRAQAGNLQSECPET